MQVGKRSYTLLRRGPQLLHTSPNKRFNDLLKQPIYSITQNSFINFDIVIPLQRFALNLIKEAVKQLKFNLGISWTTSIILASGGLKLFMMTSNYFISVILHCNVYYNIFTQKLHLKDPEKRNYIKAIQENVFLKDIAKDGKFYVR